MLECAVDEVPLATHCSLCEVYCQLREREGQGKEGGEEGVVENEGKKKKGGEGEGKGKGEII